MAPTADQFGRIPVAQAIPRAPYTWESRAVLPGNRQESGKIRMAFSRPIVIVGCHASIVQLGTADPDLVEEDTESLDVLLELDRGDRFTSANMDTGNVSGEFVTLAALDQVKGGRYLDLVLPYAAPVLQITYRHGRDITIAPARDCLVKLAFYTQYVGE